MRGVKVRVSKGGESEGEGLRTTVLDAHRVFRKMVRPAQVNRDAHAHDTRGASADEYTTATTTTILEPPLRKRVVCARAHRLQPGVVEQSVRILLYIF